MPFNTAEVATLHSQLSGVLAAFSAMVFPALGNSFHPSDGLLVSLLIFAFVALAIFSAITVVTLSRVAGRADRRQPGAYTPAAPSRVTG